MRWLNVYHWNNNEKYETTYNWALCFVVYNIGKDSEGSELGEQWGDEQRVGYIGSRAWVNW